MRIFLDEPAIDAPAWVDDLAPMPAAAARPVARREWRRWQLFVACYGMMMAGVALLLRELVLRTGGNAAGGTFMVALVALVALAMLVIILTLAGRAGRL